MGANKQVKNSAVATDARGLLTLCEKQEKEKKMKKRGENKSRTTESLD